MGNTLNKGSAQEGAFGFGVMSMEKLTSVKGRGGTSVMHFVVTQHQVLRRGENFFFVVCLVGRLDVCVNQSSKKEFLVCLLNQ